MSYVDQNLISGESVYYRTGLHWSVLLWPCLFAAFFGLPGTMFIIVGAFSKDASGMVPVGLLGIFIAAVLVGLGVLRRASAEFAITNKRVIIKVGIIKHRTAEMFLNKIESVGVEQGLLGRMLGYGAITVRGTGGTPEPFNRVPHPLEFRRQVQEQIDRMSSAAAAATAR